MGSGCARCGSTDGALYKWAHVSIHADEVVWLCLPCFRHVLGRQRLAVKENTDVLQSAPANRTADKLNPELPVWMLACGMIMALEGIVVAAWLLFRK